MMDLNSVIMITIIMIVVIIKIMNVSNVKMMIVIRKMMEIPAHKLIHYSYYIS